MGKMAEGRRFNDTIARTYGVVVFDNEALEAASRAID